jgi:biopolymer transport protein ExbB
LSSFNRGWRRSILAGVLACALACPAAAMAQAPQTAPQAAPAAAETPAPPATIPPVSAPAPDATVKLPRDLTPWGMFLAADIVVKAVMIGLAFASVITWTIWVAKVVELYAARQTLRAGLDVLGQARSLQEASGKLKSNSNGVIKLVRAAETELRLSAETLDPDGVKERIASRLERLEAEAGRNMNRGTGLLATIGATAPFVGLFGTVWGIMNSFIGISRLHTTNLAVVAPGIAEALLATALGLVAAIPAVVLYNMFARWIASYRALYADASAEVMRMVSRDFDRGAFTQRSARRAAAE